VDSKFCWVWLRREKNQGEGTAIRTALEYVDTELMVVPDADLEYPPSDLLQMLEMFLYEYTDAVTSSIRARMTEPWSLLPSRENQGRLRKSAFA